MHPLPRTSELAYELDADPRAVYFEQAAAGVPVRMALIAWLMEKATPRQSVHGNSPSRFASRRSRRRDAPIRTASRDSKAHTSLRASRSGAASTPRSLAAQVRFLRARAEDRVRRPCAIASLLSLRRKSARLRSPMDRRRIAGRFRQREAGRGGRLRALQARPAARNYERRRGRARGGIAGRPGDRRRCRICRASRLSASSAAARCSRFGCAI